jgi:hypothetical protein
MNQLREINDKLLLCNDAIEVEYVFCSDWKFLALAMGIKNATSIYFCPWCYCTKDDRQKLQMDFSMVERNWNSDTSSCTNCKNKAKKCPGNHGYEKSRNLLLGVFDESTAVLDVLHAILRTSELMESALFADVDTCGVAKELEEMARSKGNNNTIDYF